MKTANFFKKQNSVKPAVYVNLQGFETLKV